MNKTTATAIRCKDCKWIHEADSKHPENNFMGVELCEKHRVNEALLEALKNYTLCGTSKEIKPMRACLVDAMSLITKIELFNATQR